MSLAPAELRAWPVPLSEPQPATSSPVITLHRGLSQDVLPLAPPLFTSHGGGDLLSATARRRGRVPVASMPPTLTVVPAWDEDDDGPRATPAQDLPDAQELARTIASTTLEVLTGARPASQLLRWMAADVHAQVSARCAAAASRRRPGAAVPRTAVRGMTSCAPSENVVEIAAVVVIAPRVRAMALRMEGWDGRWRVTALELR